MSTFYLEEAVNMFLWSAVPHAGVSMLPHHVVDRVHYVCHLLNQKKRGSNNKKCWHRPGQLAQRVSVLLWWCSRPCSGHTYWRPSSVCQWWILLKWWTNLPQSPKAGEQKKKTTSSNQTRTKCWQAYTSLVCYIMLYKNCFRSNDWLNGWVHTPFKTYCYY